jgi:hypothetical protein
MLALKQNHSTAHTQSFSDNKTHTTLYDVIEAVATAIAPGEERLIGAVVTRLLGDYHARLEGDLLNDPAKTKGGNRHLYLYRRPEA